MQVFSPLLFGLCLLTINLVVVIVAAFLGWLPAMAGFALRVMRAALRLSFRLYSRILVWLRPLVVELFGIDVNNAHTRTLMCIALSILLAAVLAAVAPLMASRTLFGLAALHGLLVGVLWEEMDEPAHLRLGKDVE